MVIWVPRCISFSISNKDLGTGVGRSILTQEQGLEWSHTNFVIVKQKKIQSPIDTVRIFSSFNLKKKRGEARVLGLKSRLL